MRKLLQPIISDINRADASITIGTTGKETALHVAVREGRIDTVRVLLENNHDVNAVINDDDQTALHWAAYEGLTDMVRVLLENGADVNARDKLGQTALHWAAYKGHTDTVRELLENGADVNAQDNDGNTPLHKAMLGSA